MQRVPNTTAKFSGRNSLESGDAIDSRLWLLQRLPLYQPKYCTHTSAAAHAQTLARVDYSKVRWSVYSLLAQPTQSHRLFQRQISWAITVYQHTLRAWSCNPTHSMYCLLFLTTHGYLNNREKMRENSFHKSSSNADSPCDPTDLWPCDLWHHCLAISAILLLDLNNFFAWQHDSWAHWRHADCL